MAVGSTGSPLAYEVTFRNQDLCGQFMEKWRVALAGGQLSGLKLTPLYHRIRVPVVVRVFNPFLDKYAVERYLLANCEDVKGGTPVEDEWGFWNCKYRYNVLLKEDLRVPGAVFHLPNSVYLGSDRILINYPGLPLACRRCGSYSHLRDECKGKKCRFCHSDDHESVECKVPKRCSNCAEEGHLFRMCPNARYSSYADVVGRPHGQDGRSPNAWRPHGSGSGQARPPVEEGEPVVGAYLPEMLPPVGGRPTDPRRPRAAPVLDREGEGAAGGGTGVPEEAPREESELAVPRSGGAADSGALVIVGEQPGEEDAAVGQDSALSPADLVMLNAGLAEVSAEESQESWAESAMEDGGLGTSQTYGPEGAATGGVMASPGEVQVPAPARSGLEAEDPFSGGGAGGEEVIAVTPLEPEIVAPGGGRPVRGRKKSRGKTRGERDGGPRTPSRSRSREARRSASGGSRVSVAGEEEGGEEGRPIRSSKAGHERGKDSIG